VGSFLNYDVASSAVEGFSPRSSGLFDFTLFRGPMALTSSAAALRDEEQDDYLRLDTALTADFPSRRATLRLGDSIAAGGQWGRAVRVGGIQWATNFATQPDLLTLPLTSIAGEAAVASTVDVFVNGSLAASRDVAPGPFSITDLPIVAGSGEIIARVRDALGREHLISQRFYTSPQLLRRGLDAYAFELGRIREGYATGRDRYGDAFAQSTWRRGILDGTTAEVRAQLLEDRRVMGIGITQDAAGYGIAQAAAAASHADGQDGVLLQAGYEYNARQFSIGGLARWSDAAFCELGDDGASGERWDLTAHVGWSSPLIGSLSGAFVRRRAVVDATIASTTYSRNLGGAAFLSVTVSRDMEGASTMMFAGVTRLLGGGRSAELTAVVEQGENMLGAELRQNGPRKPGLGYGLQVEQGDRRSASADAQWRTSFATLGGEVAHRFGTSGVRVQGSGAVAMVGGQWAAMPRIDDNFAIVEVPEMTNLPVYLDNQLVAYTDDRGRAKVAGLRPYERNRISIDPVNVPLDANVEQPRQDIVPYGRGGVVLTLTVQRATSGLLRLERPDGEPIAAGARVRIGDRTYPVGLDGTIFVMELQGESSITVEDAAFPCSARVNAAALPPLPEKLRVVCEVASLVAGKP
jgi:outer membrane usher protein